MFFFVYKVDNRPSAHGGTVLGGFAFLAGAAILVGSLIAYGFVGVDLAAAALGEGRYASSPGRRLFVLAASAALSALVGWLAWRCRPKGTVSKRRRLGWALASLAAGVLIGCGLIYGPQAVHAIISDRYSPLGADLFALAVIAAIGILAVWAWPGRRWLLAAVIVTALAGGGLLAANDMPFPL